jgi:phospho-N-acetylmuramoyl-pentapeptide-transferase
MLYWLAKQLTPHYSGFNVFSYLTRAHDLRRDHRAGARLLLGPWMIEKLKFGRVGRWCATTAEDAFLQGRHAHHGRHADPHRHLREHAAVGGPHQPLRVGGARRHFSFGVVGFWTTTSTRQEESERPDRALQVFLAVAVRPGRARLFLFYTAKTPAETTLYLPFFKNFAVPWAWRRSSC